MPKASNSNWYKERRIVVFRAVHPFANRPYLHFVSRIWLQQRLQIAVLDLAQPFRLMLLSQNDWHPGVNLSLAAIGSSLRLTVEAMRSRHNGLSAIRK